MKGSIFMSLKILEHDKYLAPFEDDLNLRMERYEKKLGELLTDSGTLSDFANGHEYFGFHKCESGWVYREWAPAADAMYLTGDMVDWNMTALKMRPMDNGVFEVYLDGENALWNGCHVQAIVEKDGQLLRRVPSYINRVEQDKDTFEWCGVIVDEPEYKWQKKSFTPKKDLFIYECHIGMAQEKEGIGSYNEFRENILPRIKSLGYNTIQIMAVMEHPYYASFGYQVASFFASSSKYGTPYELKMLIDEAHKMGIAVLLDLVHSHAVGNEGDGLNLFDGTVYQYFHEGGRGDHSAWGTKLFNYDKNQVIHFLLSNLKYWLEEFRFDGFRFDGVTSMIYHDHGLGTAFTDYSKYFSLNTDTEALTYLQLANKLIREVNPKAITIAEDMSAMPGMCLPIEEGGIGFDYRLAMGIPDLWVKYIKERRDEDWDVWHMWAELTSRRPAEKYIGYAESHDQALVGDKTIIFRLCDSEMYSSMARQSQNDIIERGIALHKLIRLISLSLGGEGYLNFMGNEFGHPEWIDFPREGNGWSYFYCRRQWHLVDDDNLRYKDLNEFDRAMITLAADKKIFRKAPRALYMDQADQIMNFERAGVVFVFNFNPTKWQDNYLVRVPRGGKYKVILSSDDSRFGGHDRISKEYIYEAKKAGKEWIFPIFLPQRCAMCLERIKE